MNGPSSPREHLAFLTSFAPRIARAGWAGAVAFALGLVATAGMALSTSRLYRSEATILYERGVQANGQGDAADPARLVGPRLKEMVNARPRLQTIIKEMKLYRSVVDKKGMVDAVEEMRKRLAVHAGEGYTHKVTYDGDSRDLAKTVLDRVVSGVVEEERQRRAKETDEAKLFLEKEREHADEDLKEKEGALSSFITKHPQLAAEAGAMAASGGLIRAADRERGGEAGAEIAGLELQAAELEQQLAAAGVQHPGAAVPEAPLDPVLAATLAAAKAELGAAQKDLIEKQTHLTNEHPDVKQALRRVATAEAAERRAAAAVAAWRPPAPGQAPAPAAAAVGGGDDGRVAALRRALAAVRSQISAVKGRAAPRAELPKEKSSVVTIDTEWTRLNREVAEAHQRQTQLEARQFQAELAATLAAAGQGGQLVIADPPYRPTSPVAGGRGKIAMIGIAGSFILGILVLGIFAAFDDRLYTMRDIEGAIDDGIVVVIPGIPRKLPPKGGPGGRKGGSGKTSAGEKVAAEKAAAKSSDASKGGAPSGGAPEASPKPSETASG
jgi:uncharacterized protein involved in exopolysaccharide biosynthesis